MRILAPAIHGELRVGWFLAAQRSAGGLLFCAGSGGGEAVDDDKGRRGVRSTQAPSCRLTGSPGVGIQGTFEQRLLVPVLGPLLPVSRATRSLRSRAPPAASRFAPASYGPSAPAGPPHRTRFANYVVRRWSTPKVPGPTRTQCDVARQNSRESHPRACRDRERCRWPRTAKDPGPPCVPGSCRRFYRRRSSVVRCAAHPRGRSDLTVAAPLWFLHRGPVPVVQQADPPPVAVLASTELGEPVCVVPAPRPGRSGPGMAGDGCTAPCPAPSPPLPLLLRLPHPPHS